MNGKEVLDLTKSKKKTKNSNGFLKKIVRWFYKSMLLGKFEESNDPDFIDRFLKKRGYNEYGGVYRKDFMFIEVIKSGSNVSEIFVKNSISGLSNQVLIAKSHFVSDIVICEEYFSRI